MEMSEAIFQSHSCSITPQLGIFLLWDSLGLVLEQVLRWQETSLFRGNSYLVFVLGVVTLNLFVLRDDPSAALWSQQALERCQGKKT